VPPAADLIDALAANDAAGALRDLDSSGGLTRLVPELEEGRGFKQPELHHYTVLDHNLAAVEAIDAVTGGGSAGAELRAAVSWIEFDEAIERTVDGLRIRDLVRLAALLHDVAKPETAIHSEGRLRFPRHGPRGAEMMRDRLPELGFGERSTDLVARLIRYHLRPGELVRNWPSTDHAVRRFVADLDGHVLPLLLVNLADGWATPGPGYTREHFRRHCTFINYVLERAWAVSEQPEPPLLTGDDLIAELDLSGGRLLGSVLTSVREAQSRGEIHDRAEALRFAKSTLDRLRQDAATGA
jgi:putative nucleotidyltransferase with HDIG domain